MSSKQTDLGVISSFIHRLQTQRLPRTLAMKVQVEQGEALSDYDLDFLDRVLTDARYIQPLIARNPEYQPLAVQLISLYLGISRKALENEQGRG
ncbi:hypothetical protein [Motiliproteus sp. SC1-56]|uniref:hypothetical protein n=1 Tax=Motiliproteus sp. SC1-56 TaxID=2799565 RepID=UPI001A8E048D|nr:hypothetical protein [Motiliproteus sp. SC1-56]